MYIHYLSIWLDIIRFWAHYYIFLEIFFFFLYNIKYPLQSSFNPI